MALIKQYFIYLQEKVVYLRRSHPFAGEVGDKKCSVQWCSSLPRTQGYAAADRPQVQKLRIYGTVWHTQASPYHCQYNIGAQAFTTQCP